MGDGNSGTLTFERFRGVRLDAGREDLQRRFNLRLQNTRGMVPEIYEAERAGDVETAVSDALDRPVLPTPATHAFP